MGKIQKTSRWVPHKLNDRKMEKNKTIWYFASLVQRGVVFVSFSYREWKVDLFWESQVQKIVDEPGCTVHIDRETESIWQKDDPLCLVEQEGRGILWAAKTWKTVNTKRYQQQLTDLNRYLLEKRLEHGNRQHNVNFLHDNAPSHTRSHKTGSRHVESTQLGNSTVCGLLTRLGSFRLPLVCIDGSRTSRPAFWFIWRCEKMARRMGRSKREIFLLEWYSQIPRKMRKMCNKPWSILWINYILSFFLT